MHESVQKLADGWSVETFSRTPDSDSLVAAWRCDDHPLLLLVKRDEGLNTHYRVTFKVSSDHEEHAHKRLFRSPILDSEDEAKAMAAAIACQPMRYARKFF